MTDPDWCSDLDLIADAARRAGEVALGYFRKEQQVWWKNGGKSPVGAADYAANELLETVLRAARPDYGWLSEETEDDGARLFYRTLFVVDPIDGTRAFIGGRETWCVSVAVVHAGRPVAAVLVAPALGEEFTASRGCPAVKNGAALSLSPAVQGALRLAAPEGMIARLPPALKAQSVGHVPSLAYRLAMLADGRIDATLVKANAYDWDLAAADLILERAGARLTDLDGHPVVYNGERVDHPILCAAEKSLHATLLEEFSTAWRG